MSNCSCVLWRVSFADCNIMHFKVIAQKLEMVNNAFSTWDEFDGPLSFTVLWEMQEGCCNDSSSTKRWSVCAVCWLNKVILSCQNWRAGVIWWDGFGYISEDRVCHGKAAFCRECWHFNGNNIGQDLRFMLQPSALSWLHPVARACHFHTLQLLCKPGMLRERALTSVRIQVLSRYTLPSCSWPGQRSLWLDFSCPGPCTWCSLD